MSCGIAVVGSDSGEIPNVIHDAGLVVPEGDAGALAQALRRLRDDTPLRRTLGQAGRKRVLQHFTHAKIASTTATAYERTAASTRS
jgi:glycosyltransferase involved in cell wall biosynthesis